MSEKMKSTYDKQSIDAYLLCIETNDKTENVEKLRVLLKEKKLNLLTEIAKHNIVAKRKINISKSRYNINFSEVKETKCVMSNKTLFDILTENAKTDTNTHRKHINEVCFASNIATEADILQAVDLFSDADKRKLVSANKSSISGTIFSSRNSHNLHYARVDKFSAYKLIKLNK